MKTFGFVSFESEIYNNIIRQYGDQYKFLYSTHSNLMVNLFHKSKKEISQAFPNGQIIIDSKLEGQILCFIDPEIYVMAYPSGLYVGATNEECLNKFFKFLESILESNRSINVKWIEEFYHNENKHISKRDVRVKSKSFYRNLYRSSNINPDILIQEFLESDDAILILNGVPGTGKSLLINRAIFSFTNLGTEDVALVKDKSCIKDPNIWSRVSQYKLVILDDFTDDLSEKTRKDNIVDNILQITDGIESNDMKIIFTTNIHFSSIARALTRPGRLFDIIEMKEANRADALEVWKDNNIPEETFNEHFKDQETINQSVLMEYVNRFTTNRVERNYILSGNRVYTAIEKIHLLGMTDRKLL